MMTVSAHAAYLPAYLPAYLHQCPAAQAPRAGARAVLADGSVLVASAEPLLAGCRAIPLGIDAALIDSLYPLPAGETPASAILLYGAAGGTPFKPASHELPQPGRTGAAAPRRLAPLRTNLLPEARVRPFGVEERVQARLEGGKLQLECRAGRRAAGVLIDGPWRLPAARLRLGASYTASGVFALQAADAASAARELAHTLGALAPGRQHAALALERGDWRQFVLQCPMDAASLTLESLALDPAPGAAQPRSAWIWEPGEWRDHGAALLAWAAREQVNELFIVAPLAGARVAEPARLAGFVRRARQAGIAVTAVDGDPHMVLPAERAATVARARAYAAYNRAAAPAERLRAMQFDVEPYLLDDAVLAPGEREREYLAMARALHTAAAGMPLEFVLPFWWWDKSALLEALAGAADGIAVMDYRTDPDEIVRFAMPFLDWGTAHGKRVRIALEAGAVAPERQRRYTRAENGEAGELLLAQVGDARALVLLRQPVHTAAGPLYRFSGERLLDGSATSFQGQPDRLRALLPALERDLSAWPAFGGIALHGWR